MSCTRTAAIEALEIQGRQTRHWFLHENPDALLAQGRWEWVERARASQIPVELAEELVTVRRSELPDLPTCPPKLPMAVRIEDVPMHVFYGDPRHSDGVAPETPSCSNDGLDERRRQMMPGRKSSPEQAYRETAARLGEHDEVASEF